MHVCPVCWRIFCDPMDVVAAPPCLTMSGVHLTVAAGSSIGVRCISDLEEFMDAKDDMFNPLKAADLKCSDEAKRFLGVVALRAVLGLRLTDFDCILVAKVIEELEARSG